MTDTRSRAPAHRQPVIVTLPAEIDIASAGAVGEQLAAALTPGTRVIIADMSATTFCDSMGIGMLVRAHKHATAQGTELRLLLPCPDVLRVMTVQGAETVLATYHGLEEALAGPG
jgi:anti-sigma B factor antagonist